MNTLMFADLPPARTQESTVAPEGAPRLLTAERRQLFLQPMDLESLLPPDHRARVIWEFTEGLDLALLLAGVKAVEGHAGHPAIDPCILLSLWLYALTEGVGSARALDRLCQAHDAYRWILGGVTVNYHTLSDFRREHEEALDDLLTQSLGVMLHEGLVTLEQVAQDGMRVRASAGAASFRREPRLRACLAAAEERVREVKQRLEQPEGDQWSPRQRRAQERAARERQERVQRALALLPEAQAAKKPEEVGEARVSTTDPEARVMKMADGGFRPAYHVQYGTDTGGQVIAHVDVLATGSDAAALSQGLDAVEKRCGQLPQRVLADGGFMTEESIEAAEGRHVAVYGPVKAPKGKQRDRYDARASDGPGMAAWRARMATAAAQEVYRQRGATAECVNALARLRSLTHFWVRGLRAARCVALLVALAHNLLRHDALRARAAQPAAAAA